MVSKNLLWMDGIDVNWEIYYFSHFIKFYILIKAYSENKCRKLFFLTHNPTTYIGGKKIEYADIFPYRFSCIALWYSY